MRWVFGQSQPAYLRIGKKGEPVLTPESTFAAGRWQLLRSGSDATILACGTILGEALEAAGILANAGIQAAVWNCASVKPLDFQVLRGLCGDVVFSIEEHSIVGGFGSAVAEFLSAQKNPPRLIRLGIPDEFLHDCGEQEEARLHCGLDAAGLARRIADELK
jgi:transketolase